MPSGFSPLLIMRPVLWLAAIVVATILLRRRRVSSGVRLAFIVSGILVFGFVFAQIAATGLQPNPVASLRIVLGRLFLSGNAPGAAGPAATALPIAVLILLLVAGWISNKSICGWVCPFGLLQDLVARVPAPKWQPPFRLTNTVRVAAQVALVVGIAVVGIDWIGRIDPFSIFSLNLSLASGIFVAVALAAAAFVYRPWCRYLCPFGLVSWVVEQASVLRPRINRDACAECKLCVRACPTSAMADFYEGKSIHADCFACGQCIAACPKTDAIAWRRE